MRVLPLESKEWVFFTKFHSIYDSRVAYDLMKRSGRFKGCETISQHLLQKLDGTDALLLAETQIAGSWAISEQDGLHDMVARLRQKSSQIAQRQRARWYTDAHRWLLEEGAALFEVDPPDVKFFRGGLPTRLINCLLRHETNPMYVYGNGDGSQRRQKEYQARKRAKAKAEKDALGRGDEGEVRSAREGDGRGVGGVEEAPA